MLEHLIFESPEAAVAAYQIGFDLYENSTQMFMKGVRDALSVRPKLQSVVDRIDWEKRKADKKNPTEIATKLTEPVTSEPSAVQSTESADTKPADVPSTIPAEPPAEVDTEVKKRLTHLFHIISGDAVRIITYCLLIVISIVVGSRTLHFSLENTVVGEA